MDETLVSVIIPSYNRAGILLKSVESVLNQTYRNLELIIVDDGSTDNTTEVIATIKDERLKCIHLLQNMGACAARNKGIDEANGEYIAFQDSDDIWYPDKLKLQMDYIRKTSADMVYCGIKRRAENSVKVIPKHNRLGYEPSLESLLRNNEISTQTMLMRREVAESIKFDTSFRRLQDWDFSLRAVSAGYRVKYMGGPLVSSVVRDDSITTIISSEQAYLHLLDMHKYEYSCFPKAKAHIYYIISYRYRGIDNVKVGEYLKKSLLLYTNVRVIFIYMLNCLGIWK